jgi:hypothetical protein
MQLEHVHFNDTAWVASKTLEEFLEHEKHHGLDEKKLKEIHKACVDKHKPKKEAKVSAIIERPSFKKDLESINEKPV